MKTSLYLQHESGAMHELTGRRLKRIQREILAGRGGAYRDRGGRLYEQLAG